MVALLPALILAGGLLWQRHQREQERKRHGRRPTSTHWFI